MTGSRKDPLPVTVIGAGGHAKVVIATLRAAGTTVATVLDDDPVHHGRTVLGVEVTGAADALADLDTRRAVLAVGDNRSRRRLAERLSGIDGLEWATAIHPAAWVDPDAEIGAGSVVFAGAVVQPGAVLGRHVIVNTNAGVDHDCRLDDFAHAAPGCHLAAYVHVGEGALLGVGSALRPGVTVGSWTVVGAGATVVEDLPAGVTAVGTPARPRCRGAGEGS